MSLIAFRRTMAHFSETSRNISLVGGTILRADCLQHTGIWVPSTLDLNTGIGNVNGNFVHPGRNFSTDARGTVLQNNTILSASLRMNNGNFRNAAIDLDIIVGNDDGNLAFVHRRYVRFVFYRCLYKYVAYNRLSDAAEEDGDKQDGSDKAGVEEVEKTGEAEE